MTGSSAQGSLCSFTRYRARALGFAPSGAAACRAVPAGLDAEDLGAAPEDLLWERHAAAMVALRGVLSGADPIPVGAAAPGPTLLDLKVELSRRLLGPCRLCWLRCPVDRRAGQTGACGLGAELRPYADFVHVGEELELIPTHAVYLAGCNYRCAYCSDWTHVDRPRQHPEVPSVGLSRSIDARRREGALSVSFIGGLPDVNLPGILAALQGAQASVPVVWNSNMSATPEAHDLLEGVVDAYVADLKYGNEACAREGSAVKGSLAVAQDNLRRVAREAYLIVRHLVLPGHLECCARPAIDWLAEHLPGARVNLMGQYRAPPEVRGTSWDQAASGRDLEAARAHARSLPPLDLALDLVGPGRISELPTGPWAHVAAAEPAPPVAPAFDSKIDVEPDGRVVVENLSPELAGVLQRVAPDDPELQERARAGAPWRPREEP